MTPPTERPPMAGNAATRFFGGPPLMVILMLITNNRKIMGDRVNGVWINVLGWGTTAAITVAAIAMVWTWLD